MTPRVWPLFLALALAAAGCGGGAPGAVGVPGALRPASPASDRSLASSQGRRVVAAGRALVPPGWLVSAGSGALVSSGSAALVSAGSARYGLLMADLAPGSGASVRLLDRGGLPLEQAPAGVADAEGRFMLEAAIGGGLYRLEARLGAEALLTLASVGEAEGVTVTLDPASTMVASRLIQETPLRALDVAAYGEAVGAVREALTRQPLPADWTSAQAASALARLEASDAGLRARLETLEARQAALEARMDALSERVDALVAELQATKESLQAELAALLARTPGLTDAELAERLRARQGGAVSAATPPASSAAPASPAPSPAPASSPAGPPPAAPSLPPSAEPSRAPSAGPTAGPAAPASDAPPASPSPGPAITPLPGFSGGGLGALGEKPPKGAKASPPPLAADPAPAALEHWRKLGEGAGRKGLSGL